MPFQPSYAKLAVPKRTPATGESILHVECALDDSPARRGRDRGPPRARRGRADPARRGAAGVRGGRPRRGRARAGSALDRGPGAALGEEPLRPPRRLAGEPDRLAPGPRPAGRSAPPPPAAPG